MNTAMDTTIGAAGGDEAGEGGDQVVAKKKGEEKGEEEKEEGGRSEKKETEEAVTAAAAEEGGKKAKKKDEKEEQEQEGDDGGKDDGEGGDDKRCEPILRFFLAWAVLMARSHAHRPGALRSAPSGRRANGRRNQRTPWRRRSAVVAKGQGCFNAVRQIRPVSLESDKHATQQSL